MPYFNLKKKQPDVGSTIPEIIVQNNNRKPKKIFFNVNCFFCMPKRFYLQNAKKKLHKLNCFNFAVFS